MACQSQSQKVSCFIPTGESDEFGLPIGNLTNEQINPYWLVRADENVGELSPYCRNVQWYESRINVATLFQLYYYREDNGVTQRIELAEYTGQTGQEAIKHNTDLRWVSPGTEISFGFDFDQPGIDVPVDPGSTNNFEIDLTQEVPNMFIDPETGTRNLYLDVTSLWGSSLNTFSIWAGPPNDSATIPSDVNARNVYLLNNPTLHQSNGINVYSLGYLPYRSEGRYLIKTPLLELEATDAGKNFSISIFDIDAGSGPPPIIFFFDTVPEEEWSISFGNPGVDPDGYPDYWRCAIGVCHDVWIDPPYQIKIPDNFGGGTLTARYSSGQGDRYGFEIKEVGQKSSCDSYPITFPANILAGNPTLNTQHQIYKSDGFEWLSWNIGITATAQTLADSLIPPGNIGDYTNHGDVGAGLFGYPHVVARLL